MTSRSYHAPDTLEETVSLLTQDPEGTVLLGGGTVAVPALRRSPRVVRRVVDLRRAGLSSMSIGDDHVLVGATTSYARLLSTEGLEQAAPILVRMARGITGGASIRNQGTIGGAACQRNPGSDIPGVLVALEAQMVLRTAEGLEEVPALEFLQPEFAATHPPSVLTAVRLLRSDTNDGYTKLKFAQGTWPIVTSAVRVQRSAAGVSAITIVLGGVARTPLVVPVLNGASSIEISDAAEVLDRAADRLAEVLNTHELWSDEYAPAEYRRDVAPRVALACLKEVLTS